MPETTENKPLQKIEIRDRITREDVRAEKDKIFLFGDNLEGRGFGGQAQEMRGEANSIGIPTKKAPSNNPKSFFSDHEFNSNKKAIDEAFSKIPPEKTIVIPKAGLGTGLAQLPQKAPKTFVYLNQKLAEIGFHNPVKDSRENQTRSANKVIVQNSSIEAPTAKRLLDLNNINTASLLPFAPTTKEIEALKIDPQRALTDYADRLREDYKSNKDNFRAGIRILSDSLEKGEQITITCSCRGSGGPCHAEVVKMAVEKVSDRIKTASINQVNETAKTENLASIQENSTPKQVSHQQNINPRTRAAINEILSFSENDRVLEKINETDGRNRSEQANHLGKTSQFIRDLYERNGQVVGGYLIVPQEKFNDSPVLAMTTESYAVQRINNILQDEEQAKELAPVVVEYGTKIAGLTADGETKLKVFGWIYESLEGKSEFLAPENTEKSNFTETLEKIRGLAEEMHSLEPLDKTEFVPLAEIERGYSANSLSSKTGETLDPGKIYEDAINLEADEQSLELEPEEKIKTQTFERIDLMADVPRIPADYTLDEISQLINETLPEIDQKLENGIAPKEILAPFNEAIRNSAGEDAQKRLESIYQKQEANQAASQTKGNTLELNQNLDQQLANLDFRRQKIIELTNPTEYLSTEKEAIQTFYRRQKQEIGNLLTKIDESRQNQTAEKNEETSLKKELKQIREAQPNFAFKLPNSPKIVVGNPSEETIQARNFVSSYISYQLEKPEMRFRYENERYRDYAARLESVVTRDDVMKTSAAIRAENAELGKGWNNLTNGNKEKIPRPLTNREMQFLFTEASPVHYTNEMTAARLSFAHSGASRRHITESLLKGEIKPSPEAQKLIESLESRLVRRDITNSLFATKHFCLSLKTPNEELKYKNKFDHQKIYQKLPSYEKDFVFQRASRQKENLEYQLIFKKEQLKVSDKTNRAEQSLTQISQAEKSFYLASLFHQAQGLGSKIDTKPLMPKSEINSHNFSTIAILLNNQPTEKLENLARELQKSENPEKKKIGEIIQTFSRAEISKGENKTTVSITLPENRLVSTETYRELLEKFYPDNPLENEKYKFENRNDKEVAYHREKGQDEALQDFREEINSHVYQNELESKVSENKSAVLEKLDKIGQFQIQGRNARRENEKLVLKYTNRTAAKMQAQNQTIPLLINQQNIVSAALGGSGSLVSGKIHDQFLSLVQKEITITDFEKFGANEKLLNEMKDNIKHEFGEISESLKVLEENKLPVVRNIELTEKDQNHLNQTPHDERAETKPLSLQIFEKELEKAQNQLTRQSLKEKLDRNPDLEKNFDPQTIFSNEERTAIKSAAVEIVKEKLEPKELNADNRKISPEASRQAFTTYKQFERASSTFQTNGDKAKITEAFFKLDREAEKLNQIRQDYTRNEKFALMREGIKTDLVDFYNKNQNSKSTNLESEINKILTSNLNKADFVKLTGDEKQLEIMSRQFAEKLEADQIFVTKEKAFSNDSRELVNSAKNPYSLKNDRAKASPHEKAKDAPVLFR